MSTVHLTAAQPADGGISDQRYSRCRDHVLTRIEQTTVGSTPFYHAFVEDIFPTEFYEAVRAHMLNCKYSGAVQDRFQDNPNFINKRFNLVGCSDEVVIILRKVFSDDDVKTALMKKFYVKPSQELAELLQIHDGEFEYFFTKAGSFQNIHIDIPPKLMSFVFYIPENDVPAAEQSLNATVLYDKSLVPHHPAKFKSNSVCVFVPHYYSYHGFSSTIDRDVLVMFYIDHAGLRSWQSMRQATKEEPPFTGLRDAIERKLRRHPLIEYGDNDDRLLAERAACRVNAPQGRVIV